MKKIILFTLSVLVLLSICACEKQNVDNSTNSNNIISDGKNKNFGEIKNDKFEAVMEYDGDHYILKIFTYLVNDNIRITYNENNILIDATSIEEFDTATRETNEDLTTISVKLSANEYYAINIINLQKKDLKLGKDIVIE